jgi:ring-1,2-phenylacetyl-CoA epoxidase subunit PaaC
LLALSAYQLLLYDSLAGSADGRLAGIAAKARLESAYHLDHSALWTKRLGDGTEESHRRMRDAVEDIWPYTGELFEDDATLRPQWTQDTNAVLAEAMLTVPAVTWGPTGGRHGQHTEHLGEMLREAQSVHRAHPGAVW